MSRPGGTGSSAPVPPADPLTYARLAELQAQIRPHFLFNALTTIQSCVRERPAVAEDLIGTLADYLRAVLTRDMTFVLVVEELRLVQVYLGLERARLGGRVRTVLDVDPRTLGLRVPSMILQPLVENAVVHAAARRTEGATLRLAVRLWRRDDLLLMVADDGPGFERGPGSTPSHSGPPMALENVRMRLFLLYGRRARLKLLHRRGGGAIAAVLLPGRAPAERRGGAVRGPEARGWERRYAARTRR